MVGVEEVKGWGPVAGAEDSKGWGPGNHGWVPWAHQLLGPRKPQVGVQEINSGCPGNQGPVSRKSFVVVQEINGMVPRKTIAVVQEANGWGPGNQWLGSRTSMAEVQEINGGSP